MSPKRPPRAETPQPKPFASRDSPEPPRTAAASTSSPDKEPSVCPPGRAIFAVVVPRVELEPEEKRYASRDARFRGATRPRVTRASHRASAFARTGSRFAPRTPRSNPRRSVTRLFRSARARRFSDPPWVAFPALTPRLLPFPSRLETQGAHRLEPAEHAFPVPRGGARVRRGGVPRRGRALSRRGPRVRPQVVANERCVLALVSRDVRASDVADAFRDACDAHAEEPRLRALALKRYLCGMSEKGSAFSFVLLDARTARVFAATTALSSPVAAGHAADGTLLVTCTRSGAKAATAWPPRWAPGEQRRVARAILEAGTPPTPPTPRERARIFSARPRRARRAKRGSPPSSSRSTPLWARRRRPSASLFQAGRARRRAPSGAAAARRARPRRTPRGRRRARPRTRLPSPRGCSTCPPAASCTGGSTCSRSSSAPSGEAPRAPGRARAPPPRPKARAKARARR